MCYHTANYQRYIIVAFLNCTISDNRIIKELIFWSTERLTKAYLVRRECAVRTHIGISRDTEESISTAQLRYTFSRFNEIFSHIHQYYLRHTTRCIPPALIRPVVPKIRQIKDLNMNCRIVARKRMQRIDLYRLFECCEMSEISRAEVHMLVCQLEHLCVHNKNIYFFFIRTCQKHLFCD